MVTLTGVKTGIPGRGTERKCVILSRKYIPVFNQAATSFFLSRFLILWTWARASPLWSPVHPGGLQVAGEGILHVFVHCANGCSPGCGLQSNQRDKGVEDISICHLAAAQCLGQRGSATVRLSSHQVRDKLPWVWESAPLSPHQTQGPQPRSQIFYFRFAKLIKSKFLLFFFFWICASWFPFLHLLFIL